jgi:hypothetical protein
VQRLQYFQSQSTWDADEINRRRLELLVNDPATAPHARGVIAIGACGDRKDGTAPAPQRSTEHLPNATPTPRKGYEGDKLPLDTFCDQGLAG